MVTPTWDLLVHTWDLAKGTSQNSTMDPLLTEVCFAAMGPQADALREMEFGNKHIIGPRVPVPDNASLQDQLLGAFGRQP